MFTRVNHVVIAVTDLDAAVALYGKSFGLKSSPPDEVQDLQAKRVRFDAGNAFVDLVQPISDASPLTQFIKDRGEGIYLIAVKVDDFDATLSALRQKGAQIITERGKTFISPSTTHGALMELLRSRSRSS